HDPDSFLAEKGAEGLRQAVSSARTLLESLLLEVPAAGGDPNERAERIGEAIEIVNGAPDRLLRYELLSGLSRATGVPVAVLAGDKGKKQAPRTVETAEGARAESPLDNEETVLSILLSEWPASAPLLGGLPPDVFRRAGLKELAGAIREADPALPLDFSQLESHVGADAGRALARLLLHAADAGSPAEAAKGRPEGLDGLRKRLLRLKIRLLEERRAALQPEIQAAERAGDSARQLQLSKRKNELSTEISRLKAETKREPNPRDAGEGE
ncbi:MAG TPA: hypothetical protein VKF32_14745, partial [Thermoanaerobaculia bacterium]|nr:hypothetical protein [Thermoanaerobaculia bacterium]